MSCTLFIKSHLQFIGNKKARKKALIAFITTISFVYVLSFFAHILISETDSLPQHYFLQLSFVTPHKNDLTVVWSNWYQGKIIKKIVGVAGDKIWYDPEGALWVNHHKIGSPKTLSSDARILTAISPQIIPKDKVFLCAFHEKSFDSRYQELGLISTHELKGRVLPIK